MTQTPPITAVDTRVAAFIGHIPGTADPSGTIHRTGSWADFNHLARLSPNSGRAWNDLAHAVHGYYLNGGTQAVVAECRPGDEESLAAALKALAAVSDISILVAPGMNTPAAYAALTDHCEARRDRVAILDGPAGLTDDHLNVLSGQAGAAGDWRRPPDSPHGTTTLYVPRIRVADPEAPGGATVLVYPAGHIAGVWARQDTNAGVHKAPAGLEIVGALDVDRRLTEAEQGRLNPAGVNCLRVFPGRGVLVWGARTLSPDPDWRYVNVRRLVNMITTSICDATGWVHHEPNNESLWLRLRISVEDFLFGLWRAGVLVAAKPEEAYFVRCDRTTMTQADLDAGRLNVLIGLAIVRPAEFVVLRLGYSAGGCAAG